MNLIEIAKAELIRSNADKKHPFRFFTLSTLSDFPESRWVVKRKIDEEFNILVYTDSRSPKVAQIQSNPKYTALFYHPRKRLQIRMKGEGEIIPAESVLYKEHLKIVKNLRSIQDFNTSQAPGTAIEENHKINHSNQIYFSLIQLKPESIDVLLLRSEGHLRSKYVKVENIWNEIKLIP